MFNIGDTIKCKDSEEMVKVMHELTANGIETEFMFEKNGERGLWLEITKIE